MKIMLLKKELIQKVDAGEIDRSEFLKEIPTEEPVKA